MQNMGATERPLLGYVALFSSVGTLLCCALPALLVLLGFGATVASVLSAAPWLVTLSRNKGWIFAFAAMLLGGSSYYVYRIVPRLLVARGACAADDTDACRRASRASRVLLWISSGILAIAALVAYVIPLLLPSVEA
jgi:mercuric ion transport protein